MKTKVYSKKGWGKLFQVRLSKDENNLAKNFFKNKCITRRQFLIDSINKYKED